MPTGLIDVHSHLIPGVDDGCRNVDESIACARVLVAAGYTHSVCTPHVWPSFPKNNVREIPDAVAALQRQFDEAGIALKLLPGGELNLGVHLRGVRALSDIPTYAMRGRHALIDLWCDCLPDYFEEFVKQLQGYGLRLILAHPERMKAVQAKPELADYFADLGLLLQGNLNCISGGEGSTAQAVAERYLREQRYFMLGSDLHRIETLPGRMKGLERARELVCEAEFERMTVRNPLVLIDGASA